MIYQSNNFKKIEHINYSIAQLLCLEYPTIMSRQIVDISSVIKEAPLSELQDITANKESLITYFNKIDPKKTNTVSECLSNILYVMIRVLSESNFNDFDIKTNGTFFEPKKVLQTTDDKIFSKIGLILAIIYTNEKKSCNKFVGRLVGLDALYRDLKDSNKSFRERNINYLAEIICELISYQKTPINPNNIHFTIVDSVMMTEIGPVVDFRRVIPKINKYKNQNMINFHDHILDNMKLLDKYPLSMRMTCIRNIIGLNPIWPARYDNIRYICQFILSFVCSKLDSKDVHITFDPLFFYKVAILFRIADDIERNTANVSQQITDDYRQFIKDCAEELSSLYVHGRDAISRENCPDIEYIITCFCRFFYIIKKRDNGSYKITGSNKNSIEFICIKGTFRTNLFDVICVTSKIEKNLLRRKYLSFNKKN